MLAVGRGNSHFLPLYVVRDVLQGLNQLPLLTVPGQPVSLAAKPLDSRRVQLTWEKPLFSLPVTGDLLKFWGDAYKDSGRKRFLEHRLFSNNISPVHRSPTKGNP